MSNPLKDAKIGSVLKSFFLEDGIKTHGTGQEQAFSCWNKKNHAHGDKNMSASLNVVLGMYYCQTCKLGGNAISYLVDRRGMDRRDAWKLLNDNGIKRSDISEQTMMVMTEEDLQKVFLKTLPNVDGRNVTHCWDYYDEAGVLIQKVFRRTRKDGGKAYVQCSPSPTRKGWWRLSCDSKKIPTEDVMLIPPAKLPLLNTRAIVDARKDKFIFIVEGEKCVDALSQLKSRNDEPIVATTWMRGTGQLNMMHKHNFELLKDRRVCLISDEDDKGREFMTALSRYLVDRIGVASCKLLLAQGESTNDIADIWLKDTSTFCLKDVEDYIAKHGGFISVEKEMSNKEKLSGSEVVNNDFYRVLGRDSDGRVVIRNKKTNIIRFYSDAALAQQATLQGMAPNYFWVEGILRREAGAKFEMTKGQLLDLQNRLMRVADALGIYDASRMFGRGAAITRTGLVVFNKGDKLLCQSRAEQDTLDVEMDIADSSDNFEARASITVLEADKIAAGEQYARDMADALMRYRWDTPESGVIFCGWIVESLVGGALPFRPVVWIKARRGSGKTYLLKLLRIIMDNAIFSAGNATAAGIDEEVRSDSLGVLHDEFEPSKNPIQFAEVMNHTRLATGGEGMRLRGGVNSKKASLPRYSFMAASISQPDMSPADKSRILTISLGKPVANWEAVEAALETAITPEKMAVMRSYIIRHTPAILRLYKKWEHLYSKDEEAEQRSIMARATLSAGYEFLTGITTTRISQQSFDTDDTSSGESILSILLGYCPDRNDPTTVMELINQTYERSTQGAVDEEIHEKEKRKRLTRLASAAGMTIRRGESMVLRINYRSPIIKGMILRGTGYEHFGLKSTLESVPGITPSGRGKSETFGDVRSVYLEVSEKTLREFGLGGKFDDLGKSRDEPPPPDADIPF